MAETTGIQWTDATVNFWWGCTKVSPGCDHCYAETWSKRWEEEIWGVGAPRRKIKSALKTLYRLHNGRAWWAADHQIGRIHDHSPQRVFLQSMSDLFDSEVPQEWFDEAWDAISACHGLELQLVTKRLPNVEKRLAGRPWPSHAGLIISIVNQDEANRDIPRLLALKAKLGIPWVGLSMEPLLGPVILKPEWLALLDWVIVGGESGPNARPMHPAWARSLRDQCGAAMVPFFFKQWGEWKASHGHPAETPGKFAMMSLDPNGWTHTSAVMLDRYPRQFSSFGSIVLERVGKAKAGRFLDGMEHNAFPEVSA